MYRVALNTALLSLRKKNLVNSEFTTDAFHIPDDVSEENELQLRVNQLYNYIAKLNELDKTITFLYIKNVPVRKYRKSQV